MYLDSLRISACGQTGQNQASSHRAIASPNYSDLQWCFALDSSGGRIQSVSQDADDQRVVFFFRRIFEFTAGIWRIQKSMIYLL